MTECVKCTDVAIIGAGPAGIAAAIYLRRAGLKPVLYERNRIGGLLRNAGLVENYPGFPEGLSGRELCGKLTRQLTRWSTRVTYNEVAAISYSKGLFTLLTATGKCFAKCVILATGTRAFEIDIEGLEDIRKFVHYEIDELPRSLYGKTAIIIGGGDAAFDYALSLRLSGCKVTVIVRSSPSCIGLLMDRTKDANITVIQKAVPIRVWEEGRGFMLECIRSTTGGDKPVVISGNILVIACGRGPEIPQLDKRMQNAVSKNNVGVKTTVPGFFVAGDVARGLHRQASIASGDGVNAAMLAFDYICVKTKDDV